MPNDSSPDTHKSNGSLQGRCALITGASSGIGLSIARRFAAQGADVALLARNRERLEAVVKEIQASKVRSLTLPCDVCCPEAVREMAEEVIRCWRGIDILVNSAGRGESSKFINHPDELWHSMIATNLTSVYYVCKAFVPTMVQQQWGRIINIASVAALTGAKYIAAYTAAKHGVLGITRALAVELASQGITVNAICPGYVETPMTESSIEKITARTGQDPQTVRRSLENMNPQQRLIDPDEIAAVALLLAGEEGRGITGQAIPVDGGMVI